MKLGFFLREALRSMTRNAVPSFAALATVLVATHDHAMVDRMRRRVIELSQGKIVRDERGGQYAPRELTTAEFGALMREAAAEPGREESGDMFDDAFAAED